MVAEKGGWQGRFFAVCSEERTKTNRSKNRFIYPCQTDSFSAHIEVCGFNTGSKNSEANNLEKKCYRTEGELRIEN